LHAPSGSHAPLGEVRGGKRKVLAVKIAAITMVFNERVFLPIWLNHYGQTLGYEHLFVIDDGSTDGSTDDPRILHRIRKQKTPLDEDDRARLISRFHAELLEFYDVVIYTDADEIIVVDPAAGLSLGDYLRAGDAPYVSPAGLNVLHRVDAEPPLDFAQPLFAQRHYAQFNPFYCKPLIARIPMEWSPGFHASQYGPHYDANLLLFHLRAMDFALARERIKTLNTVVFSENAIRQRHGSHFRLQQDDYLRELFPADDMAFRHARRSLGFVEKNLAEGMAAERTILRLPPRFRDAIALDAGPATPAWPAGESLKPEAVARLFANAMDAMIAAAPNRDPDQPCPCGSGRHFARCHGARS
jgi:hypothetical protein